MNRRLVLAEWRRAQVALKAANLLAAEGCSVDAVSRTYYAVFHAAKAALLAQEIGADTHSAVRRMFSLHLIKTAEIEKEWAVHLAESFDDRLAADYDPEITFSPNEVRQERLKTRRFLTRMRRFLLSKGFKSSELRSNASHG